MLIRYPGSKDRHKHLLPLVTQKGSVITEPFCGTASVSFSLLEQKLVNDVHLNDADENIACLWKSVVSDSKTLVQMIKEYTPSAKDFYNFKENPGYTDIDRAFRLIVLHQISYSGLGRKAGSPIGGRYQTGSYKVDCRWRPKTLEKKILKCSFLLNSADKLIISSEDWSDIVSYDRFMYVDPPYFEEGSGLYVAGDIDHSALAYYLKDSSRWVLSYDDCEEVRDLYSWADIQRVNYTSGLNGTDTHKRTELVITPC